MNSERISEDQMISEDEMTFEDEIENKNTGNNAMKIEENIANFLKISQNPKNDVENDNLRSAITST